MMWKGKRRKKNLRRGMRNVRTTLMRMKVKMKEESN